ncbi:MAG: iron ABC transporter permease [Treponema sp.]|nr:iron ABC transporter permease [Treponema sp.]
MSLFSVSAFTVVQALCSTVIALVIGIVAAFFTAKRSFPFRDLLLSFSSLPLCFPAILLALGYVSFFGLSGTLNNFIKSLFGLQKAPVTFLYSFFGIIIAQGFYNFPLVMGSVHDCWTGLPQRQEEAARILGAGEWRVFRSVTIYQLLPSILSSCMLVFLYCFFSFLIILLFGGISCTTLEVEIYKSLRATLNFSETARLACTETFLACLFVGFYVFLEQKSSLSRGTSFYRKKNTEKISGSRQCFFAFCFFFLIILFFVAPLFSIFYNAFSSSRSLFTFSTFLRVVKMNSFSKSLVSTILTACATSTLCVIFAFFYSVFLRSFDTSRKIWFFRMLPMIPMAFSSVVTGAVIILLVKRGSYIHLVLAQFLLTWPLAFRQIHVALSKVSQETVDAAKILSQRQLDLIFRIYLPQSFRGILSAAGFCFAVSAGDTTLPLVLAIPKYTSLSLFTYRLASSYRFHEACAAGMILGLICTLVFVTANKFKGK